MTVQLNVKRVHLKIITQFYIQSTFKLLKTDLVNYKIFQHEPSLAVLLRRNNFEANLWA